MSERVSTGDEMPFPFSFGMPIMTREVVAVLGSFTRKLSDDVKDFPREVIVNTLDGRTLTVTMESLYADGGSQSDGTFYFTTDVRTDDRPNKKFLFGSEIHTITFTA
jgi:hypothetical protein